MALNDETIIVRDNEGADALFAGPWDIVWNNDPSSPTAFTGDYALADPALEPNNVGGFQALFPLTTAIILCLFVDRRRPDWMPADPNSSPRGWHGDGFDIDAEAKERPMGSLLWTLERATATEDTGRKMVAFALEALQTLVDQKRVYRFDVVFELDKPRGLLALKVQAYNRSGQNIFANTFPFIQR